VAFARRRDWRDTGQLGGVSGSMTMPPRSLSAAADVSSSACPVVFCRPTTVPISRKKRRARPAHDGAARNPCCSGEPPQAKAENVGEGTKKEQTQAHRTALDEPDAPLSCSERPRACSTARQRTVVPRSGRRGRRFKSCHPDQCHRSLTCGNAVPCARRPTSQRSRQRPRGNKKEHEGTPGKAGADFDGQKNTRPPRTT
jgi:hypothetical protein